MNKYTIVIQKTTLQRESDVNAAVQQAASIINFINTIIQFIIANISIYHNIIDNNKTTMYVK